MREGAAELSLQQLSTILWATATAPPRQTAPCSAEWRDECGMRVQVLQRYAAYEYGSMDLCVCVCVCVSVCVCVLIDR